MISNIVCKTNITIALLFATFTSAHASSDCVVLLHGLARSASSMSAIEDALHADGYQVVNIGYESRDAPIPVLATSAIQSALAACPDSPEQKIHFVTHSLGGILVRQYLTENKIGNLGRVVMLAPPNKGSQVVDSWKDVPGYHLVNGPAGLQLGTDDKSIPLKLGPVTYPVGVIAGTRTFNPILSLSLPNPDDGKVSVENTKVDGMADFIEVPHTHTFIMNSESVIHQIKHFLKTGKFQHESE